jgi:hypothetical protein
VAATAAHEVGVSTAGMVWQGLQHLACTATDSHGFKGRGSWVCLLSMLCSVSPVRVHVGQGWHVCCGGAILLPVRLQLLLCTPVLLACIRSASCLPAPCRYEGYTSVVVNVCTEDARRGSWGWLVP